MICWKCHEPVGGPVCVGCGAIQPPQRGLDSFALLGLDRRYHLDPAEVDERWRAASLRVHPDRFAGRPAVERRMALQWTASLNQARAILKDPARRARYLATGQADPDGDRRITMSAEFLEEIFELQASADEQPEQVQARALELRRAAEDELDALFTRWEADDAPLDGERVEQLLSRLKYVANALALVTP